MGLFKFGRGRNARKTVGPEVGQQTANQPSLASLSDEDKRKLYEEFRNKMMYDMFALTRDSMQPNGNQMLEKFRNLPAVQWNVKAMGSELASRYYKSGGPDRSALLHDPFVPNWCATRFDDYLQEWFLDTCNSMRLAPVLHRKIWEEVYITNVLKSHGKLAPGSRGIVFGVGQERLPSYFASMGVDILATDLAPDNQSAKGWIATAQHGSLERLYFKDYLGEEQFKRHVSFTYADMNNISPEFEGKFDFCWSTCAFEHLGSIEKGLSFVENTGRLLRPGGVSVHTTEFNYTNNEETIDNWPTVLFRRRDFEKLAERLRGKGFVVPPLSFDVGSTPVDNFIDIPPFPQHKSKYFNTEMRQLHLKLMVDGFPATCYGVNFRRA